MINLGDRVQVRSIPKYAGIVVEFRNTLPTARVKWHENYWTWEDPDTLIVVTPSATNPQEP